MSTPLLGRTSSPVNPDRQRDGSGLMNDTPLSIHSASSTSSSLPQTPYGEWDDESFGSRGGSGSRNDTLETLKGVANRFVFSQFYIFFYLATAAIALTTVFLSATSEHCPSFTFYVLEVIVNTAMIVEVSIRLFAFGKQFWVSYYNTLDLLITLLCIVTLTVIFFKGCSAKNEEVFDTFLLVVRNLFQFGRLALVLRKSGKNVFSRPAPIDLSSARTYSLDLDLDDEEALSTERRAMGGDFEAMRKQQQPGPGSSYLNNNSGGHGGFARNERNGTSAGGGERESRPFLLNGESDEEG